MQQTISGETSFKALKNTFTIGPSDNGYTLCYGVEADGVFTALSASTEANKVEVVNGVTPLSWFKLSGNTGEVKVIL